MKLSVILYSQGLWRRLIFNPMAPQRVAELLPHYGYNAADLERIDPYPINASRTVSNEQMLNLVQRLHVTRLTPPLLLIFAKKIYPDAVAIRDTKFFIENYHKMLNGKPYEF